MSAYNRLRLHEDLVPVSALQAGTSRVLREIESSGRYKVITREGTAVAVMLGVDDFERLQDDASIGRIVREVREAEDQIERGEGISHAQMERELTARWPKAERRRATSKRPSAR